MTEMMLPEEETRTDAPQPKKRKRRSPFRRLLTLLVTLAVVLGIVLVAAYFDLSSVDSVRRLLTYSKSTQDEQGRMLLYSYNSDKSNRFAALDDRLLVVSTTEILLLDAKGNAVYTKAVQMEHPAISAGGKTAAVYDIGGTSLFILDRKGLRRDMSDASGGEKLISVSLNNKDDLAVTAEKSGCKAAVTAYDVSGKPRFTFNSSDHFLMDACIARDGRHLAAAALDEQDGNFQSTIMIYELNRTESTGSYTIDGSLALSLDTVGSTVFTLSDDSLTAATAGGNVRGTYGFEYPYLRGVSFGGTDFAALLLSRYRSGNSGRIVSVGTNGSVIASLDVRHEALDISAAGRYIAVLYSDSLVIYRSDLTEYASLADTQYARGVLMRDDGTALLIGSSDAWLFVP